MQSAGVQDYIIMLDAPLVDLVAKLQPNISSVKAFVVLTSRAHMPKGNRGAAGPAWLCFDDLIEAEIAHLSSFVWTPVPETTACGMCFTSGTTGKPKVRQQQNHARCGMMHGLMMGVLGGIAWKGSHIACMMLIRLDRWGVAESLRV